MMKGQIAGLMRQAQQMQENMKKAQEALASIEVEGAAGGGLVKVVMTCRNDVRRITIDPSLLEDDKDMLEDLVAAAMNDALRKAETTSQEKMSSVTAGLPLPPGMCLLCDNAQRDKSLLCIVETPADQNTVESSHGYQGLYYVLMGRLAPIEGIGPNELQFDRLLQRASGDEVQEIILATNFTAEGETTAHYLAELLRQRGKRVTRLARGVPAGSELEYVDASTMAWALQERRET